MPTDVYKPCPFCAGTEKKVKFCCAAIADDMAKVAKRRDSGQDAAALKTLDKLAESHPTTPWNEGLRASLLLNAGRADESLAVLEKLQKAEPENRSVAALHAAASLASRGFDASRQPVWRAFRKAAPFYPDLVSGVAVGAAGELFNRRRYPAAREHLAVGLRFAAQDRKQDLFVRLMEFDGNNEIPYPLRSVHPLHEVTASGKDGDEEFVAAAQKARRIAESGCFGAAADKYAKLAEQRPNDPGLRSNVALCRMWDGSHKAAAAAFRLAAGSEKDFETAAEYEALAQLLSLTDESGPQVGLKDVPFTISSVAALLSDLDGRATFHRLPSPDDEERPARLAAVYELLDRPMPVAEDAAEITADDVPRVVGEVTVLEGAPGEPPRAILSAFEGDELAAAETFLAEVPGLTRGDDPPDDIESYSLPAEMFGLRWRWAFPESVPQRTRRAMERAEWDRRVDEVWPTTPLAALGGRSPEDARGDADLRIPLAGALYVLDAVCDRGRYELDLNGRRESLGLPRVEPLPVPGDAPVAGFSAIRLYRTAVSDLTDRQLLTVLNRALLVHTSRFLRAVLTEVLGRPAVRDETDPRKAYEALVDLARDRLDYDAAFRLLDEGREWSKGQPDHFEDVFRWDTRELAMRLEDPSDPALPPLIERLDRYYSPKLPQFRAGLRQILAARGLELPAEPAAGGGAVWTPDAAPADAGERPKLILPGM